MTCTGYTASRSSWWAARLCRQSYDPAGGRAAGTHGPGRRSWTSSALAQSWAQRPGKGKMSWSSRWPSVVADRESGGTASSSRCRTTRERWRLISGKGWWRSSRHGSWSAWALGWLDRFEQSDQEIAGMLKAWNAIDQAILRLRQIRSPVLVSCFLLLDLTLAHEYYMEKAFRKWGIASSSARGSSKQCHNSTNMVQNWIKKRRIGT